jgi:hypothetical protein
MNRIRFTDGKHPETQSRMPLRIEVHHQNAISPSAEFGRQIDGDRRFSCATLSVRNRENACSHLDSSRPAALAGANSGE